MMNQQDDVSLRLERIEETLQLLVQQRVPKDWYSVAEVAHALQKAEYTVREHCRLGRIRAAKRRYNRGPHAEWMVSHEELTRVRNEGLLPINRTPRQ
jgi:hypothetical protein